MSNTFGRAFRLTTFGESHGPAVGGVVDGCPAGLALSGSDLQAELELRRPGRGGQASSARNEADRVEILSGLFEGMTLGTPIGFIIRNNDQRPADYERLRDVFRPGHGDYAYQAKYGLRDHRGGGRASGRETAARVAGGAVALKFLAAQGIRIRAWTIELGGLAAFEGAAFADGLPFFAPDAASAAKWEDLCALARESGDSLGGMVLLNAEGLPPGLGEPVFDRLDARIGAAMLGVGAVKGVEIGAGFTAARLKGSENNDLMTVPDAKDRARNPLFASNRSGGVLAGISSGQALKVRVAVKPAPSIGREQNGMNASGKAVQIEGGGRHDVCVIPRIVPVLKAMLALTLADFVLLQRLARL